MNSAKTLREEISADGRLVAIGAWDVLSAKIISRAGFDMVSLASFCLSSAWGVPDVGVRTASDLLELTFKVTGETETPVLLDIEQGFGATPGHAAYWAREYERAGAAAVHIDDKGPVQMCSWLPDAEEQVKVGPVEETVAKISAIADATDDLVIIARCSLAAEGQFDVDEEMRRLALYRDAGADVLYAPKDATLANDLDRLKRARRELGIPLMVQFNPPGYIRQYVPKDSTDGKSIADRSYAELFESGASIIHGPQLYAVAYQALMETLEEVQKDGSLRPAGPKMMPFDTLLELVGYDRF